MRALALVALLAPGFAYAEWPEANPARPSFSDNSDTTAVGALEIEAGVASADDADLGAAQWTLKYGVSDRFDIRVNLENTLWGDDVELASYGLLLKYTVRPSGDRSLGLAVEPYVTFPSPNDGPEGLGGGLFLVGTYKRDWLQLDACIVTDVATAEMADTAVTVSPIVAAGFPIAGGFGGYVEPGIEIAVAGDGASNPFVGAGLTFAVTKFLVLDAAFYVADDPRTQFFAGVTYSMYVPPR